MLIYRGDINKYVQTSILHKAQKFNFPEDISDGQNYRVVSLVRINERFSDFYILDGFRDLKSISIIKRLSNRRY